jgi:hypothetical protein
MSSLQKSRLLFCQQRVFSSGFLCIPEAGCKANQNEVDQRISHVSHRLFATLGRRKRKKYEKYDNIRIGTDFPGSSTGMEEPFEYSGDSVDEYTEKATLSPWTPVPDSVARKIFDSADVQEDDVRGEYDCDFD